MQKRGNLLTENIIFLVLNLAFLTILFLFLFSKMGSVAVIEEYSAKQISLFIDSAKPGMKIFFNMEQALEKANNEKFVGDIVSINNNIVTVKLSEKSGYSYAFFNDVQVIANGKGGGFYLSIDQK